MGHMRATTAACIGHRFISFLLEHIVRDAHNTARCMASACTSLELEMVKSVRWAGFCPGGPDFVHHFVEYMAPNELFESVESDSQT